MGLYEQIRREYGFGVGSVIGIAWKLGVHRRMVREAVRSAVPAQRKKTERPTVKMAAAASLVEAILELDRKAPRKQRHTSRRIYERILAEVPGCQRSGRCGSMWSAASASWVCPNTRRSFRRVMTGA